ncbi:MAG: hypothetical protein HY841_01390, partial [Bacteroidetes bacterium]|nr:hypothetical protein [Bacteroidota bacterium]
MKKILYFRSFLLAVMFILTYSNNIIAQNNNQQFGPIWDKDQPSKNIFENLNYNNVGIGTITPSEKLHVKGNLKVEGKIFADSMKVSRILPPDGDSLIHFGPTSVTVDILNNRIFWTPAPPFGIVKGLTIANGASSALGNNAMALGNNVVAFGNNSMALGNNINTGFGATNSFAVGQGVTNNIANTFQLGFGGITFFADATGVGINNLTSHTQTLDVNGTARIRNLTGTPNNFVVTSETNGTLHSIAFTGSATDVLLGNGTFGPISAAANAWLLNGNITAFPNNVFGTLNSTDIRIFTNATQRGIITAGGLFGFGPAAFIPTFRLDVVNNINIAPTNFFDEGYRIDGKLVLYIPNDNSGANNTFVGRSGNISANPGNDNTYVGFRA